MEARSSSATGFRPEARPARSGLVRVAVTPVAATRRRCGVMARYLPLFERLNEAGVRYVVVGGVAVVIHGYPRLTADLDIAVDLSPPEAAKVVRVLTEAGLKPRTPVDPDDFADPAIRSMWHREKGMRVFSLYDPDDPLTAVDIFTENPFDFESVWERAEVVDVDGTLVRVASVADLVAMKRIANRPQDIADIAALDAIESERRSEP